MLWIAAVVPCDARVTEAVVPPVTFARISMTSASIWTKSPLAAVNAVATFSQVIQRKPEFAEGWNKRATLYFMLGEYTKSLADCDEVVRRNPYHWGALSGYGMIYLQLDQPARALEYFQKALAVNPNLSRVEDTIEELKAVVIQRRKDSI